MSALRKETRVLQRDKLIDYLIAEHHTHCCDCATYREAANRDWIEILMREYIIVFGERTQAETDRLRAGEAETLCYEIAKKKGHTL